MTLPLADPRHVDVSVVPFIPQPVLIIQVFFSRLLVAGQISVYRDWFGVKL